MCDTFKLLKDFFPYEEAYSMYNRDYIEVNLKNIILSGYFHGEFIPISKINLQKDAIKLGWDWHEDPWLKETVKDKLSLGQSIVENGTYYPIVVSPIGNSSQLYVIEGHHRIMSLKLLSHFGTINDDFKVFCLISPYDFTTYREYCNTLNEKTLSYRELIINQKNCEKILNNSIIINILHNHFSCSGYKIIDNYVVEKSTSNCFDILNAMTKFSMLLRDLFYIYRDIQPNRIINNEQEYLKWIKI